MKRKIIKISYKDKSSKITGGPLSITDMNLALYGQMDPDMPDLTAEQLEKIYDIALPKLNLPAGKIIMMGTGGAMENNNRLENLFYKGDKP
jgi:hypothetical protein